jgi:hypothetical protein
MNPITAYAVSCLFLCFILVGCTKEPLLDPEEAIRILAPIQGADDPVSIAAAIELSILLEDLSSCLFANKYRNPGASPEFQLSELKHRMKAWREVAQPPHPIVLSLEPGLFQGQWGYENFKKLAAQYPYEQELWEFFEKAARFIWDSAPSTPDTYVCHMIWSQSPLKGVAVGEIEWEPTVEPVLQRFVAELRFKVKTISEYGEQGPENIYGATPTEFKASIMQDAQAIHFFLDEFENGRSPSLSEIEVALSGRFMKEQAKYAAGGIELFQNYRVE